MKGICCLGGCGGTALSESQTQYPTGPGAQLVMLCGCSSSTSGAPSELRWGHLSEL